MKKIVLVAVVSVGVAVGVAMSIWYFRESPKLNTEQVETVFLLSGDESKIKPVEEAILAFQRRDPQAALAGFNKLLADPNLTDEEKEVVQDLIKQVNKYLGKP